MKFFIYASLLLLSTSVLAEDNGFKCKPEGNQSEMNQCAYEDFQKADKKLNDTYQALIKKAGNNKTYIKKLRVSQRAWVKFRDAELETMFSCDDENLRVCWGSMIGMLHPAAKQELTEERTKRLQRYIDEGQNIAVDDS